MEPYTCVGTLTHLVTAAPSMHPYQGLEYNPEECKYPADEGMQINTKKRKQDRNADIEKRPRGRPRNGCSIGHPFPVTEEIYLSFKKPELESRLTGDLSKLTGISKVSNMNAITKFVKSAGRRHTTDAGGI